MEFPNEQQLKDLADELGQPVDEIKLMIERATEVCGPTGICGIGLKEEKSGGLKKLLLGLKKNSELDSEEDAESKTKYAVTDNDVEQKMKERAVAFLNLPPGSHQLALMTMKEDHKLELQAGLKLLDPDPVETKTKEIDMSKMKPHELVHFLKYNELPDQNNDSEVMSILRNLVAQVEQLSQPGKQLWDSFTSKDLNGGEHSRKPETSVYDLFSSQRLNPNRLEITTKADMEASRLKEEFYNAFTSQEIGQEQPDNRVKTGQNAYDMFTSRHLNR